MFKIIVLFHDLAVIGVKALLYGDVIICLRFEITFYPIPVVYTHYGESYLGFDLQISLEHFDIDAGRYISVAPSAGTALLIFTRILGILLTHLQKKVKGIIISIELMVHDIQAQLP